MNALESWLEAGFNRIGEISIVKKTAGFVLVHHADSKTDGLQPFTRPEDARAIARCDAAGGYRPLKSAPNLRRGWELRLQTVSELHAALDFFYPAMLGAWLAHEEGRLVPVHFRETAARQSGMYDIVKKITGEQADELAGSFCKSDGGCLKTILWKLDRDTPLTKLPPEKFDLHADQLQGGTGKALPLPCVEACNLLVAAAREIVKKGRAAK